MGMLAIFAVVYFLIQGAVLWRLGQTKLRSGLKALAALMAILLVPSIMYADGLYRELGDGGAANAVVSLLAAICGFITAFVVFVLRSIAKESSVS
jgi:ABC-type glycerol-3-phosphate transport system permease component